jgi:hypothetical protein
MNAAHAHLLLNHIPIFGTLSGLLPLLYALVRGNDDSGCGARASHGQRRAWDVGG